MAALIIRVPNWNQLKCPSTDSWINKMWSIHTVDYYSAIKGSADSFMLQRGGTSKALC